MICSALNRDTLRRQYRRRNARVTKGDTVKVMRGEYSGIEGKLKRLIPKGGPWQLKVFREKKLEAEMSKFRSMLQT